MKIRPVRAELFHIERRTDGRTDRRKNMTKLIVDFRNFVKTLKKSMSAIDKNWFAIIRL